MDDIMTYISSIGFPIVVAMYSLVRLEKTMMANTEIMTKLYERLDDEVK